MPDHKRAPVIAGLLGAVTYFLADHDLVAACGVAGLLLFAHVSDQLHYLIRRGSEESVDASP